MKVDIDVLGPVQRKIHVELPPDVVGEEFSRVYGSLVQKARVKGFRRGKVPRLILEGIYGGEVKAQVLSRLVENSLQQIFRERQLPVISRPHVEADELEEGKSFTFSATVEVKPRIEVKDYMGLPVEKVKITVSDAQVEDGLRRFQESHAHLAPVEENHDTVEQGDFVSLDFVGFVEGRPFPGGKTENYLLEVGAGNALPEFEKGVVGLKRNAEHTMKISYPENYFNRDLAGKTAQFSVIVHEIKKKVLPALDDDFAKDYGECATLGELKEKIRTRLENQLQQIQARDMKEQILTQLIQAHPFEVPAALLEEQLRYLVERRRAQAEARTSVPSGEKPEADEVRLELETQARRQVQAMLLIEEIARIEKIAVSEETLQKRIDDLALSAKEQARTIRRLYEQEGRREELRSQVVFDRALDFLLQNAKVNAVDAPLVDEAGEKG